MDFVIYDKQTGQVLRGGSAADLESVFVRDGFGVLETKPLINTYVDLTSLTLVPLPEQPSMFHEIDWGTKTWFDPRTVDEKVLMADAEAKATRSRLLAECDWTQLPDVPQQTKDLWVAYRQALRDITNQPGYPLTIEWPVEP